MAPFSWFVTLASDRNAETAGLATLQAISSHTDMFTTNFHCGLLHLLPWFWNVKYWGLLTGAGSDRDPGRLRSVPGDRSGRCRPA